MLSSRENNGVRNSARKYAVHGSSPLAKDSTMVQVMRSKRKESFSTSNHMHGLGGEAKEAMLRSGLRVKRTNSLRIVATKGNATLTGAFHHAFPVPDLDMFRKNYTRKEDEFAESIPSAMCPFQFVANDADEIVTRWTRTKSQDEIAPKESVEVPSPEEDSQIADWLKDMRMKVHSRLAQKQQFANTVNPIETQPLELVLQDKDLKKPTSPKGDDKKKKVELTLDTIVEPLSPSSSPSALKASKASRSPRHASNRVSPAPFPTSASSPSPNKKHKKEKRSALPPLHRKAPMSTAQSADKPRLPKIASHDSTASMLDPGPLFYPRNDAIFARRTYSEQDVRRVRAKARNSVGLEPIAT